MGLLPNRRVDDLHRRLDHLEHERSTDKVAYAEWRGQQSELTTATVKRLGETNEAMTQGFIRVEQVVREGFQAQTQRLERVEEQTLLTNGSVASALERVAALEATDAAEIRANVTIDGLTARSEHARERAEDVGDRRRDAKEHRRQYTLAQVFGAAGALGALLGGIAGLLSVLHVI